MYLYACLYVCLCALIISVQLIILSLYDVFCYNFGVIFSSDLHYFSFYLNILSKKIVPFAHFIL